MAKIPDDTVGVTRKGGRPKEMERFSESVLDGWGVQDDVMEVTDYCVLQQDDGDPRRASAVFPPV